MKWRAKILCPHFPVALNYIRESIWMEIWIADVFSMMQLLADIIFLVQFFQKEKLY